LLRGRFFGPQDRLGIERALIVDPVFAARHWPGEDALGKSIRLSSETGDRYTIVGIVPTVRLHGYTHEPRLPQAYLCARQFAITQLTLLVRATGNPTALANGLRQTVRDVDPNQPLSDVRPLAEQVGATFGTPRLYTFLLSIFAGLALLLATIGLYGVLAYQVSRRQREFGIRLALGALASQITALVLRRGLRLVGTGVALGLLCALALGRLLSSLLYRTSAFDTGVIATVTALLALVALFASWLPARRAAKVDPLIALRAE
jgi:putative ABC transport system permease protein